MADAGIGGMTISGSKSMVLAGTGGTVATVVIAVLLVVVVFFALRSSRKHMKGEGGCCGGGGSKPSVAKKNLKKVVDEKILVIDGMRCEGCASAVSDALNSIDHIRADVDLKKKTATVRMEEPVGDMVLTRAVSKAGYTVSDIK